MLKKIDKLNSTTDLTDEEIKIIEREYSDYIDNALGYITLGSAAVLFIIQIYLFFRGDSQLFPDLYNLLKLPRVILIISSFVIISFKIIPGIKIRGLIQSYILLTGCTITSLLVIGITRRHPDISMMWLFLSVFIGGIITSRNRWTVLTITFLIPLYFLSVAYYQGVDSIRKSGLVVVYILSFGVLSLLLKYYFSNLIEKLFYSKYIIKKLTKQNMALEMENKINDQKDEFLANTAHEIRTPLNGIIGLIENYITSENRYDNDLYTALTTSRRLSLLVNDIIDYSKLKYLQLKVEKRSVPLGQLIDLTVSLLTPLTIHKDITIEADNIEKGLNILGDENRILQILYNIVGNGIKYTDKGSVSLNVRCEGERVYIEIRDTGRGIPEDKLGSIFENYSRVEGSEDIRGSGIGLYVTRQLAELQGGTIEVSSVLGKGTTFTISFIKSDKQENKDLKISKSEFIGSMTLEEIPYIPGKPVIYIVDDDPVNLKTFQDYLKSEYNIKLFANGNELLKEIKDNSPPDLILLDLILPDNSGVDICREIREKHNALTLPIVIVTARSREGDLTRGLESGANEFLNKPVLIDELKIRVSNLIELKKSHERITRGEQIVSFIEALVEITASDISLHNDDIFTSSLDRLHSILININRSELEIYKDKVTKLSGNLKPYIENNIAMEKLIKKLLAVYSEKESFSSFIERYNITPNQADIIRILFEGEVIHERIAEILGKSTSNIGTTLRRVYDKVGVSNQTELLLNLKSVYME